MKPDYFPVVTLETSRALLWLLLVSSGQALAQPVTQTSLDQIVTLDCTVYYTPRESGFIAEKGFDLHPVTRPGLHGRTFAADFLRAVRTEGHGLLISPENGLAYIYYNGSWGYTALPRGSKEIALVPLQSCAVSVPTFATRAGEYFKLDEEELPTQLTSNIWEVVDVGSSVGRQQIDLYWGEDNPMGCGSDLFRPAGTAFTGLRKARFLTAHSPTAFKPVVNFVSGLSPSNYTDVSAFISGR